MSKIVTYESTLRENGEQWILVGRGEIVIAFRQKVGVFGLNCSTLLLVEIRPF